MKGDGSIWRADLCRWLLQLGIFGALLGIGYLVWGGLQGYFTNPADPPRVALVANTLAYFLYCCGWAVGLGLIGLYWEWRPVGLTTFLSGVAAWFLMPFAFAAVAGANTDLTMRGVDALRSFLTPLLLVSFVQMVWAFVEYWRSEATLRWRARSAGQLVVNLQTQEKPKRPPSASPSHAFFALLEVACGRPPNVRALPCQEATPTVLAVEDGGSMQP